MSKKHIKIDQHIKVTNEDKAMAHDDAFFWETSARMYRSLIFFYLPKVQ